MNTYDDEECPGECDVCRGSIAAGADYVVRFYRGTVKLTLCDRCDTNNGAPGGASLGRPLKSITKTWSCDCQPCQSRRLVGGLVVSVATTRGAA